MKTRKIHICGTHGSGKSTLGKMLSQKLKIPLYSLVDIKYNVKYSQKRSPKEIKNQLKKISKKKKWITEECWSDHAEELFKKADKIIIILTPKRICQQRILKRFILRKKEKEDTLKSTINMARQVGKYYSNKDNVSIDAHLSLCKKYKKTPIILTNKKQIKKLLESLK